MTDIQVYPPQYDNREGFGIIDWDKVDYDCRGTYLEGVDKDQAEYGVMLLQNDGLGDLTGLDRFDVQCILEEMVARVECVCGEVVFAGELSSGGECPACLS